MKQELLHKQKLPDGWKIIELEKIAKITMGLSPKGESYNKSKEGMPLLNGAADIKNGKIAPYQYTTNPIRVVKKGDLLLCIRATIGNLIFSDNDYCIGRGVAGIRITSEEVNKNYLKDYIETRIDHLKFSANGGIIKGIKREDLTLMKIPLPPKNIQDKIASKFDQQMAQISIMKKEVEKEKEAVDDLEVSLLETIFPVDPSLWPKEWKAKKLRDIISILGDGLHGTPSYSKEGNYFFINGNNLEDGSISLKDAKRVSYEEYIKYKKPLNDRTVLVSINGTLGKVAFYHGEKVILGKSACYFNLNKDIDKDFIKAILKSKYFIYYAHKSATGSIIKNVSLESMRDFIVPIPPHDQQIEIVRIIDEKYIEIKNLKERVNHKLAAISQLPSAILNEVFGKYSMEGNGN